MGVHFRRSFYSWPAGENSKSVGHVVYMKIARNVHFVDLAQGWRHILNMEKRNTQIKPTTTTTELYKHHPCQTQTEAWRGSSLMLRSWWCSPLSWSLNISASLWKTKSQHGIVKHVGKNKSVWYVVSKNLSLGIGKTQVTSFPPFSLLILF